MEQWTHSNSLLCFVGTSETTESLIIPFGNAKKILKLDLLELYEN